MILYHGSTERVEKPIYGRCRAYTDFGRGFYTTTSWEQAEKWARLKLQREGKGYALKTHLLFDQISFNSQRVIDFLTFIDAKKIGLPLK